MEKFFKRKRGDNAPIVSEAEVQSSPTFNAESDNLPQIVAQTAQSQYSPNIAVNLDELPSDPGLRKSISEYGDSKQMELVRPTYLTRGPCQPKNHNFPWIQIGNDRRRFIPSCFEEFGRWLEYSVTKEAAFCLFCYLFRPNTGGQGGGGVFVSGGFSNWKKKHMFKDHVGPHLSIHNKCMNACDDLMKQDQHIEVSLSNHSEKTRVDYRIRLIASLDCLKYLLRQGLAMRGHDESVGSSNRGNFLQLLQFLAEQNEAINKVVLKNAPENHQMIAPSIQKELINAAAYLTTKVIIKDIGDEVFSILVDESRDISVKEQMAVTLRYVNKKRCVVERFLGIAHVIDTTSLTLKASLESLLLKHGLSMSSIRGQGYDGASNMKGEFNGLKSLILRENSSAYYVHCFAHQLQLALVAVANNHNAIGSFFLKVSILSNVVGASCKRRDIFRMKQYDDILEGIYNGDRETGRGLNQEEAFTRAGDTRWGSHYGTLLSLNHLFSSVIGVLEVVQVDGDVGTQRIEAYDMISSLQCFDFVFKLQLMKAILGITNDLSQSLQRRDKDIVNAMDLVRIAKMRLQKMREHGWDQLLKVVSSFCSTHDIVIINMEDCFVTGGRSRRNVEERTNLHHYRVELFYSMIDMQLQELNHRFNEVNTELLLCMTCLDPSMNFSKFDATRLVRFAEFYPNDFDPIELTVIGEQLENYIYSVRDNDEFKDLKGIGALAQKMVETHRDRLFPLVYLLIKLALTLPVATASVERAFSAMKIVKSTLRNRMGDDFTNDCLVTYIEQDIFKNVDTEDIIQHFQNMKPRRGIL